MTNQPALFPVDQTTQQECPVCHAIRPAGQDKTPNCAYDQHRDGRRPKGCLNAHDPKHAPISF